MMIMALELIGNFHKIMLCVVNVLWQQEKSWQTCSQPAELLFNIDLSGMLFRPCVSLADSLRGHENIYHCLLKTSVLQIVKFARQSIM